MAGGKHHRRKRPDHPSPSSTPAHVHKHDAAILSTYAQDRIRFHANRLSRKAGFARSEREDLEQELAMDLLRALRRFDPTRSSLPTYISRVIYRRCCTLLRDSRHPMRHAGSLGERAGDQLIRDERHRMTGYEPDRFRPTVEDKETAELVQQAVSQLPDNLKQVALLLMTHTQAEASRVLGVSESSIHRSRQKIRKRLARLGLRILCESAEDSAAFR